MVTPRPDEPINDPDYVHAMYRDWVGPGYPNAFYDPYSQRAKDIYWRQVSDGIAQLGLRRLVARFRRARLPFEPVDRGADPADGPDRGRARARPISTHTRSMHVEGVYDHWLARQARRPALHPDPLGLRRHPARRRGDLVGRRRLALGQFPRPDFGRASTCRCRASPTGATTSAATRWRTAFLKPTAADLAEWRELNTRWFQFGAFSPIFRSHGENIKREIFEMSPEGSPTYSSMVWYDRLRYRLMPYIYTLGADTYFKDGTIMRGLVMDFAADKRTWGIDDEYLFGPAFLVAPVTEYQGAQPQGLSARRHRSGTISTPAEAWPAGEPIAAAAPYERMPLFVRAGSIVPTGPAIQHHRQQFALAADAQRLHRRRRQLLALRG